MSAPDNIEAAARALSDLLDGIYEQWCRLELLKDKQDDPVFQQAKKALIMLREELPFAQRRIRDLLPEQQASVSPEQTS